MPRNFTRATSRPTFGVSWLRRWPLAPPRASRCARGGVAARSVASVRSAGGARRVHTELRALLLHQPHAGAAAARVAAAAATAVESGRGGAEAERREEARAATQSRTRRRCRRLTSSALKAARQRQVHRLHAPAAGARRRHRWAAAVERARAAAPSTCTRVDASRDRSTTWERHGRTGQQRRFACRLLNTISC